VKEVKRGENPVQRGTSSARKQSHKFKFKKKRTTTQKKNLPWGYYEENGGRKENP